MFLYSKHMAQLNCSPTEIDIYNWFTKTLPPLLILILAFISLTRNIMENKMSAITVNFCEIEKLRPSLLFHKQNAHEYIWKYEDSNGSSGSVFAVVRG